MKLHLLLDDEFIGWIYHACFEDNDEGRKAIDRITSHGVGYLVIRGDVITRVPNPDDERYYLDY
jgi:hypothetical protein